MSYYKPPKPDYDKYSNRQLMAIPITLIIISLSVLVFWTAMTGVPVDRGVDFVGGTEVRIGVTEDVSNPEAEIESAITGEIESITEIQGTGEYIVTFAAGETSAEEIESDIDSNENLVVNELSQISPMLSEDAQQTAIWAMGIAFVLMSLLVIGLFRSAVPAFIVILSVTSNILIATAAINIVGIELTMGTVGAILMLIGYSVDSDIVLNTHVLKSKKSEFVDQVHDAMRTGVTMTVTSLAAMLVMSLAATIVGIELLAHMGLILAIGLAADLIITYMLNVSILRWYVNRGDYL